MTVLGSSARHDRDVIESNPIDTSTATGRLMLGVFASFAQFERDRIRASDATLQRQV